MNPKTRAKVIESIRADVIDRPDIYRSEIVVGSLHARDVSDDDHDGISSWLRCEIELDQEDVDTILAMVK